MKAILNGAVLAESDTTVVVEGNHYFPPTSINRQYFNDTDLNTACPWKGTASYYTVTVDGEEFANLGWYYPTPKDAAAEIRDHVAFHPKVTISA